MSKKSKISVSKGLSKSYIARLKKKFFGPDTIGDTILDFFKELFFYKPRRAYRRVKHILSWIPFHYNEYDWDHGYILEMLQIKITRTRDCILKNNHLSEESLKRITKSTTEAIELIALIRKDEFCEKEREAHDKKWGKLRSFMENKWSADSLGRRWISLRDNANTDKKKAQELKDMRKIWALEESRKQAAYERLGEIFKTELEGWWD